MSVRGSLSDLFLSSDSSTFRCYGRSTLTNYIEAGSKEWSNRILRQLSSALGGPTAAGLVVPHKQVIISSLNCTRRRDGATGERCPGSSETNEKECGFVELANYTVALSASMCTLLTSTVSNIHNWARTNKHCSQRNVRAATSKLLQLLASKSILFLQR